MTGNVYPIIKKLIEKETDEDQVMGVVFVLVMYLVETSADGSHETIIEWGDVHSCGTHLSRVLDSK